MLSFAVALLCGLSWMRDLFSTLVDEFWQLYVSKDCRLWGMILLVAEIMVRRPRPLEHVAGSD